MAAVATSAIAREGRLDHTIDRLGWRPPERVEPSTGVGVTAATQAQRNVAVHLLRLPSAQNLRQALLAQMRVSVEASKLASDFGAPLLAEEFSHRATVYRDLMAAARNIDGRLGGASSVVSESAQAAEFEGGPTLTNLDACIPLLTWTTPTPAYSERILFAAPIPSFVWVGGMRMSVSITSGRF